MSIQLVSSPSQEKGGKGKIDHTEICGGGGGEVVIRKATLKVSLTQYLHLHYTFPPTTKRSIIRDDSKCCSLFLRSSGQVGVFCSPGP